jgi:uncharacterized protein (DUF2062 family)
MPNERFSERIGSLKESVGGNAGEFCAFKPQHALFFVIPAQAGIQIRGVLVVIARFSWVSPLVSPFVRVWIPAFAGMTTGDECREV